MKRFLVSSLAVFALPLFAQQTPPAAPAAKPPVKPVQTPRRELSEAERRAAQDKRNVTAAEEMRRQNEEARRRAAAGQSEAARRPPPATPVQPESGSLLPKTAAIEENKGAVSDAIKNKDAGALTDIMRNAAKEHDEELRALAEKAKEKKDKLKDTAKTPEDDEPLKPVALKPLTEPRVPRTRPVAEARFDLKADDMVMPLPKEEKPGAASKPVSTAQRTVNARGNIRMQGPTMLLECDEFDGVLRPDFNAGSGESKTKPKQGDPAVVTGPKQSADFPFDQATARGKVYIKTKDREGKTVIARASRMTYDPVTGDMTLTGHPDASDSTVQVVGQGADSVIIVAPGKPMRFFNCRTFILGQDGKPAQGVGVSDAAPAGPRPPGT